MSKRSEQVYHRLQGVLHTECRGLSNEDYRDVLENLHCDIEAALEALDSEEKDKEENG